MPDESLQERGTPPSIGTPRYQLEYEWQLPDWDGVETRVLELSAITIEEARKEVKKIIDTHNQDVHPDYVGRVTKAIIKQVANTFEVDLDK